MVKAMKTTEDLSSGTYTTVLEAFIPDEVIGQQQAAVGFAFKTCDTDYSSPAAVTDSGMKFRGDPWWFFRGRFPTDLENRFLIQ